MLLQKLQLRSYVQQETLSKSYFQLNIKLLNSHLKSFENPFYKILSLGLSPAFGYSLLPFPHFCIKLHQGKIAKNNILTSQCSAQQPLEGQNIQHTIVRKALTFLGIEHRTFYHFFKIIYHGLHLIAIS